MSYAVHHTSVGRHRAERHAVAVPTEAPAPATESPRRPLARRLAGLAINAVVALCLVVFFLIAVGPHVLGYRTSTMLTGSMEPGISPGDVVVTVPKAAADLQVGDVISYKIPVEDHRIETHRVTKIMHKRDGSIAIITKGDANSDNDPWTAVLADDTVWESTAVIPKLGSAIRVLRSPAVQHGFFWISLVGLIYLGMSLIWGKAEDDEGPTTDAAAVDPAGTDAAVTQAVPSTQEHRTTPGDSIQLGTHTDEVHAA